MSKVFWITIVTLSFAFSGIGFLCLAAEDSPTVDPMAELKSRLNQLDLRVAQLEQQLAQAALNPPVTLTDYDGFHSRSVPDNWGRGQINGMTYYLIPLSSGIQIDASLQPAK